MVHSDQMFTGRLTYQRLWCKFIIISKTFLQKGFTIQKTGEWRKRWEVAEWRLPGQRLCQMSLSSFYRSCPGPTGLVAPGGRRLTGDTAPPSPALTTAVSRACRYLRQSTSQVQAARVAPIFLPWVISPLNMRLSLQSEHDSKVVLLCS